MEFLFWEGRALSGKRGQPRNPLGGNHRGREKRRRYYRYLRSSLCENYAVKGAGNQGRRGNAGKRGEGHPLCGGPGRVRLQPQLRNGEI